MHTVVHEVTSVVVIAALGVGTILGVGALGMSVSQGTAFAAGGNQLPVGKGFVPAAGKALGVWSLLSTTPVGATTPLGGDY